MLTTKSMSINGEYIEDLIDGYTTIGVSGREMLELELDTFTRGCSNGSVYKSKRYPSRTLTISFVIEGDSSSILLKKLEKLSQILDVVNAKLIFRDEQDRYYIGTRNGSPNAGIALGPTTSNGIASGSFEMVCLDPFKYSVEEYEAESVATSEVDDDGNVVTGIGFNVDYHGTYKSYPTLVTEFYKENDTSEDGESKLALTGNGDCGFVAFFNENAKIIQLGDPDEVQGEGFEPSQTLSSQEFKTSTAWGTAVQTLWPLNASVTLTNSMKQVGEMNMKLLDKKTSEYYLTPKKYGSGTKVWHGPTITRSISADDTGVVGAKDFTFTYSQKLCITENKRIGSFHALVVGGSGEDRRVIAGVNIIKSKSGKVANLEFVVNNTVLEKMEIDVSKNNAYFGIDKAATKKTPAITPVRTSIIRKTGNTVVFNIAGIKKSFVDDNITDMQATETTFAFGQYHTNSALNYNGLYSAKFVKDNCTTWRNIPNKFSANDILVAKCRTGEVLLNNAPTPEYGALGNDWEKFYLEPGTNLIGISYSDWVTDEYAPTFKLRYREVFL